MFLPTTRAEMDKLGWDALDVILVSGDSYIDSPFIGAAVIGKVLHKAGYRVGIIAQPSLETPDDITRLGEARLFWGVSAGCIDSMVANHTALKKRRKSDDYTPGGENTRRPDRATIAYTNLIRRHFKNTAPIVLGGIEASLRRLTHYDYWTDRLRGSVLLDAKADYLVYGMGEQSVLALAQALRSSGSAKGVRGLCYLANQAEFERLPAAAAQAGARKGDYLILPSLEAVLQDKNAFIDMFHLFYRNNDPVSARGLIQQHGSRYVVQNPPAPYETQEQLDAVYALGYERAQHPYYEAMGKVKALETIKFSLPTHRGCYGECNFCAIAVHEGRTIRWRSQESIVSEAEVLTGYSDFKGYIMDVGGPTANMYGFECDIKLDHGSCPRKRCLYPDVCEHLKIDHQPQIELLNKVRRVKGVKKAFVSSGIRYDMLLNDEACGMQYLQTLVDHHISGQMKIAPEHTEDSVLSHMGKPGKSSLEEFKAMFDRMNRASGKEQFLTYYMIAAHPGCTEQDMRSLKQFVSQKLRLNPEQVQIFTPTPSTYSSLMYYTEMDPFTRKPIFVEKDHLRKERQKSIVVTPTVHSSGGHTAAEHQTAQVQHPAGASVPTRNGRTSGRAPARPARTRR